VRNLTRHPHEDFNAHWSGDGRRVVFNSLRTGTSQIFAFDLISGATLRMSENTSHDLEFATRPGSH
jgi:Tol biopolymer transport system component